MTNADNMFAKLGYEKNENEKFITYKKQYETYNAYIQFNKQIKTIECSIIFEDLELVLSKTMIISFNAEKIKAINEKCKELGWLND